METGQNLRRLAVECQRFEALGACGRYISLLMQSLMLAPRLTAWLRRIEVGVCTIFLVLIGINAEQLEESLGL